MRGSSYPLWDEQGFLSQFIQVAEPILIIKTTQDTIIKGIYSLWIYSIFIQNLYSVEKWYFSLIEQILNDCYATDISNQFDGFNSVTYSVTITLKYNCTEPIMGTIQVEHVTLSLLVAVGLGPTRQSKESTISN